MTTVTDSKVESFVWRQPMLAWALLGVAIVAIAIIFFDGMIELTHVWEKRDEYSYGYIIPLLSLFLLWQRKDRLEQIEFTGGWIGIALVALGIVMFIAGNMTTLYLIVQYAFLVVLSGLALTLTGRRAFALVWVPIIFMIFMIPLPAFFFQEISQRLQLISSEIGVLVIRAFSISVFLEGNVIDLGSYKLQVVEACSGLRYLFPLMTLAFIAAYFFHAPLWKRVVIFLSSIPITILMNSFRIGVIGVMVEYWGAGMAEGFLHDFEGWAVFMACTAVLIVEMWILNIVGGDRRPLREAFGIDLPAPTPAGAERRYRALSKPFLAATALLTVTAIASTLLPARVELTPPRASLDEFPTTLGTWQGNTQRIEKIYLDELKLDDYVLTTYHSPADGFVNFYVAYYSSQKKGQSAHSPRTCIPGGGWEITSLTQTDLDGVDFRGQPLRVNRTLIRMGDQRQLVYYWFQQRGRNLTNEYLVKWFIFWDALTRNRTDGALIRLVTDIGTHEDPGVADARLSDFAKSVATTLPAYVPE